MQKKKTVLIIIAAVLALGFYGGLFITRQDQKALSSPQSANPTVTLLVNDGQTIATYSAVPAATAYDALVAVTSQHQIDIATKQYDFGVFVERIGDKTSGPTKAWIYFVNGTSADVAADKKRLLQGDLVEWKYVQPE